MCLNTVTRKIILKKDLKVKKVVTEIATRGLYFGIGNGNWGKIRNGMNSAKFQDRIYTSKDNQPYKCGFHCYALSVSDERITKFWHQQWVNSFIIVKCTIPKGTEIVYGKQGGLTCIVTPRFVYKK